MLVLGIESSCDETAAAVLKDGRELLSNVISTQIPIHTLYGGVVPEIASRNHIERISRVVEKSLTDANVSLYDIDVVGVTYGPGLVGPLLVGVSFAKAMAYAADKPFMKNNKRVLSSAIILLGGEGKRMKSDVKKQYINIKGFPVIYYTIKAFEKSNIDEIVFCSKRRRRIS